MNRSRLIVGSLIVLTHGSVCSADSVEKPRRFRVWAASCSHVPADIRRGRESLARAIRQSEGREPKAPAFDWDIMIDAGDLSAHQVPPGDRDGCELIRQYRAMTKHRREQVYNVPGNHDAPYYDHGPGSWFRKWGDPLGRHTRFSGVDPKRRPFPVAGTWERYRFQAGNILFLMLADRNDAPTPVGRGHSSEGRRGGYPPGAVTRETFNWWKRQVLENQDKIIVTMHHHVLRDTTVASGRGEGHPRYHGSTGGAEGGSYLYYIIEKDDPDDFRFTKDAHVFEDFLDTFHKEHGRGAIDFWIGGHTHVKGPDDDWGGKTITESRWGVTFLQVAALTRHHGGLHPLSRLLTFTDGTDQAKADVYLHESSYKGHPIGWYAPAAKTLSLRHRFEAPLPIRPLSPFPEETEVYDEPYVAPTTPDNDILVERDIPVPMRDGTVLRANVFRPSRGGPFPVLVQRTPYGKSAKPRASLVRAGFIVVTQDARGRYASEGQFESFMRAETHDGSDGHDTVEWAAKLPNSTGKVGLFGTSYPGFLAWRAAGARPESLGAMAAFSIPANVLDLEGPGTIRPGRRLKWWHGTMSPDLRLKSGGPPPHARADAAKLWDEGEGRRLLNLLPWNDLPDEMFGTEAPFVKQWLREPWHDTWQLERDAEKTLVPNLNVCGWYDHCNGSIDLHLAIASRGAKFEAKRFSRLIVGPWGHSGLGRRKQGDIDFGPDAAMDFNKLYADWFGHWLRDEQNKVRQTAPVRLFVMGVNEWRDYYDWPPKYVKPHEWFLDSEGSANTPAGDGRLLAAPAKSAARDQYDYDPRNPVPTLWSPRFFTVPAEQSPLRDRPDILVYQTEPLAEYVETIGYPEVVLHAASSCPDTDFFARLIDVNPDGRAIDVTSGVIRARYRDNAFGIHASPNPSFLKPGVAARFHIRMRPTAHRFLPGHRIRLDITSSDFPNYDRNHNTAADQNTDAELVTARQTVHHGPVLLSRLILPVMPARTDVPYWAEGATSIPPPRFIRQFGTQGDQPGELHSPIGIAIDAQDRVYVTEFKNRRVQVFDDDGNSVRTMSVSGQPGGIAVDKQSRVYVALMLEQKIVVFDSSGEQIREWGRSGTGDGEFNRPGGIAIGPDGSVFVVDQANHRLQRFSPEGQFIAKWGEHGSRAGQFGGDGPKENRLSGPHFCAFDKRGHLYTTEGANLRIQRLDPDGRPLFAWDGVGDGPGCFGERPDNREEPFAGPIGITVDDSDRIWVSSTNNRVQCFSADGRFLTGIGDEGAEPGEFIIPHGLAIDSRGDLYVVDASNHRIQVFELPAAD